MTDPKKRERAALPPLGGSSLLAVFAILVLTVFALLSLSTVQADLRLGEAARAAVTDYYAADLKAQEILARLRNGERPEGVDIRPEGPQDLRCAYTVPVSGTQELQVEVLAEPPARRFHVLRWEVVQADDWEPDDSLHVWDGGSIF